MKKIIFAVLFFGNFSFFSTQVCAADTELKILTSLIQETREEQEELRVAIQETWVILQLKPGYNALDRWLISWRAHKRAGFNSFISKEWHADQTHKLVKDFLQMVHQWTESIRLIHEDLKLVKAHTEAIRENAERFFRINDEMTQFYDASIKAISDEPAEIRTQLAETLTEIMLVVSGVWATQRETAIYEKMGEWKNRIAEIKKADAKMKAEQKGLLSAEAALPKCLYDCSYLHTEDSALLNSASWSVDNRMWEHNWGVSLLSFSFGFFSWIAYLHLHSPTPAYLAMTGAALFSTHTLVSIASRIRHARLMHAFRYADIWKKNLDHSAVKAGLRKLRERYSNANSPSRKLCVRFIDSIFEPPEIALGGD